MTTNDNPVRNKWIGLGLAMGTAFGVLVGAVIGNPAIGVAFGPAVGLVVALAWYESRRGQAGATPDPDSAPGDASQDD